MYTFKTTPLTCHLFHLKKATSTTKMTICLTIVNARGFSHAKSTHADVPIERMGEEKFRGSQFLDGPHLFNVWIWTPTKYFAINAYGATLSSFFGKKKK